MLIEKEKLEKMANGELNLIECRDIAREILARYPLTEAASEVNVEAVVKKQNGGLDKQFLDELNFIKCDKHYYRTKLYDNTYLEIDMNDSFASIVSVQKMETWKKERITKIVLPNKLTKERLLKLLEVIR